MSHIRQDESNKDYKFCLESLLPELSAATKHIALNTEQDLHLLWIYSGIAVKLLYSVVWQEQVVTGDFLRSQFMNYLGYVVLGPLNSMASLNNGFQ